MQQDLLRPQSAMFYKDKLQDIADEMVEKIESLLDSNGETTQDTLNILHLWAFESITLIFLNSRFGALDKEKSKDAEQMTRSLDVVMTHITNLIVGLPHWKFLPLWMCPKWFQNFDKAMETMHLIIESRIKEAIKGMKDLKSKSYEEMSVLEKMIVKNRDSGDALPIAMAEDGMLAGMDTTGNSTGFLLYHLATNIEKQEKLYQEIKSVTQDQKGYLTEKQLNGMKYLNACIKECLRLTPATLGTSRITTRDCVIGDYSVPKGTMLFQLNMIMARDKKNFNNPDDYLPERWLRENKEIENINPFASIPFSHGPRMCVGRRFATLEITLAIIKILSKFKLEYHHEPIEPETTFVNKPDKPLKISFLLRK